mgnify:FL=1
MHDPARAHHLDLAERSHRLDAIGPPALAAEERPRWITWRSILLGTLAAAGVCAIVPFNDYAVANTYMIGTFLPPVLVFSFFIVVVLVNAPLHRLAPRFALRGGELGVIMAMMLAACAIPSQGLMRSLLPTLIAPFFHGRNDVRFWEQFLKLDLPGWLYPVEDVRDGIHSQIVTAFVSRLQADQSVPYAAWALPLAIWGIFFAALFATLLALATIVRVQWADNERLPFPLAQVQLALIQPPPRGKAFNDLFSSRVLWIAVLAVFAVHSMTALNRYFPKVCPEIPLKYDLSTVMAEEPWSLFAGHIKRATIYFTFIGVTYFIQSRVAFSIWATMMAIELLNVQQRSMGNEIRGWSDQALGSAVAFVMGFLWVGRHHWAKVLRAVVGARRPGETGGDFVAYRTALLVACGGVLVMFAWLMVMGVQWWVACAIIAFMVGGHVVVMRVVAETGVPSWRFWANWPQLYTNFPATAFTGRDIYFSGVMDANGPFCTRESVAAFSLHALQVNDGLALPARQRRWLVVLMAWAMLAGFVAAGASSLRIYYRYATPITTRVDNLLNAHGVENLPKSTVVDPLNQHHSGAFRPKQHDPWLAMGIGAAVTGALQYLSLRFASWPFAPVGYLISVSGWYIQLLWFSTMIGWTLKVLIVRLGGARLYQRSRPAFLGIIIGEALAVGVWLCVNIALASAGYEYQKILILPD